MVYLAWIIAVANVCKFFIINAGYSVLGFIIQWDCQPLDLHYFKLDFHWMKSVGLHFS